MASERRGSAEWSSAHDLLQASLDLFFERREWFKTSEDKSS